MNLFPQTFPRPSPDFPQTFPRLSLDLPQTFPRPSPDFPQTCLILHPDWLDPITPFQMLNIDQSHLNILGLIIIKLSNAPPPPCPHILRGTHSNQ